jgi:hypothetical protein
MVDVVELEAPLGPLGRIAENVALTRNLTRLLERRNTHDASPRRGGFAGPGLHRV